MVVFLLLIIVAVLLFGRGAVNGFIMIVFGVVALGAIIVGLFTDPELMIPVALGLGATGVWFYFYNKRDKRLKAIRRFHDLTYKLKGEERLNRRTTLADYKEYFTFPDANPNLKTYSGETLLYVNVAKACSHIQDAYQIIELLLSKGADVNLTNDLQPNPYIKEPYQTPLWYAEGVGKNEKVIQLLKEYKAVG